MTTTSNRHRMIEVKCEWCETPFMARKQRVDKGQSRFCSREHHREWLKSIGSQRKNIGKENAIIQWDKSKNMYCAYWYEPDTMRYTSAGWGRWFWELNVGEVPDGHRVGYIDGDSRNNTLENLKLKSWQEYGEELGDKVRGVPRSDETKRKLSIAHSGKTLTEDHKKHIGDSNRKKWAEGMFDNVHKGEHNWHWRGGVGKGYPKEFSDIREFIVERDNSTCQICLKALQKPRDSHVHHIDGNREHNYEDNLILLCTGCHGKIHSDRPAPPVIMAFRSLLEWNENIVEAT